MPCTTILVGKKVSFDGSTMISRNDDGGFEAKGTVIIDSNKAPKKYKTIISKTEIELPDYSYRYTSHPSIDKKRGLWPAAGINEYNVAMNATETITSNPLVIGADPLCKKMVKGKEMPDGIGEEDLVTLVLPYVKTAREAIVRLGMLHEKYGTYEENGIAVSDENEIWWLETIGGHHYIACRVPDDKMVIMPNQFGLDNFDFEDAYGKQENYMCSKDLKEFMVKNNIDLNLGKEFNPRNAFGSHSDQDHIYNTPRAWFLLKYFNNTLFNKLEKEGLNPVSDNIPWCFTPDHKVTIQEIKYALSSYYQDTPYNPYGKDDGHGKYRSIGVPNTDICSLQQIRPVEEKELKGIEWCSFGGGAFTCMFPQYTFTTKVPAYLSKTGLDVSTECMYWTSRIIAALTDAHFAKAVIFTERYQLKVFNEAYALINKYDAKFRETHDLKVIEEANEAIMKMVKKESQKTLSSVLNVASNSMKTRFNRNDN